MKKLLLAASLLLAGIQANAQKRFLYLRNSTGTASFEVSAGGDAAGMPCRGPVCPLLETPVPTTIYYTVDATTAFTCPMTPPISYQVVTYMNLHLMMGGFPVSSQGIALCGIPSSGVYPISFPGYGTYNLFITVGPNSYTIDIM
jgi:hypothetical protein